MINAIIDWLCSALPHITDWLYSGLFHDAAIALITGIYAGLIVARLARFEDIKNEAKRIIQKIDYISASPSEKIQIDAHGNVGDLVYTASDFHALGHRTAGLTINEINQGINEALMLAKGNSSMTATEFGNRYGEWQERCRKVKPCWRSIFSLNPWL